MNYINKIPISIKEGLKSSIPLIIGFFPVAMAYGLLSKSTHISFKDSSLFSILVFAGASQFMALDLIKAGTSTGSIILATFFLNLRHLMMSASLSVKLKEIKKYWLFFIAFGITDETFSVTSLTDKQINVPFLISLCLPAYCSWLTGTMAGYLLGATLPDTLQSSLGIGLYSMFAALLIPEIKKSFSVLFLAIISGIIYASITCFNIIPSSWSIIVTIIAASAIGTMVIKENPEGVVE